MASSAVSATRLRSILGAIHLDDALDQDGVKRSWIMLLPEGEYEHPKGTLKLNRAMLSEVKSNFDRRVRGVDIALDYDHKAGDGDSRAFGWIEEVRFFEAGQAPLRDQTEAYPAGLWGRVRWTSLGLKDVGEQIYRYISAEYRPEWEDPVSRRTYRNVLIGATLTNRPFMHQMPAIQLSAKTSSKTSSKSRAADQEAIYMPQNNTHLNGLIGAVDTGAEDDEELEEFDDDEDGVDMDEGDEEFDDEGDDYAMDDAGGDTEGSDEEEAGENADEEAAEGEGGATPRRAKLGNKRSRKGRRAPAAAAGSAGEGTQMSERFSSASGANGGSMTLAEERKLREEAAANARLLAESQARERDLAVQLYEQHVDRKIAQWSAPGNGDAGAITVGKVFADRYKAFMLTDGITLSEPARASLEELVEAAFQGAVELGQRSLATADMESRRTVGADGSTSDDRVVLEEMERLAKERYGKPYSVLLSEGRSDQQSAVWAREVWKDAIKSTKFDIRKLAEGGKPRA